MSFSHVGLTVSDLAQSTSFYAAALQPLGMRYIGKQGDAVGFGKHSANFMITEAPHGVRVSPSHIAFHADSRTTVRRCYDAALKAQGLSDGAPTYRNDDCLCFNAAVLDLDGHVIEFNFRQPHAQDETQICNSSHSRVLTWQEEVANNSNDPPEDIRSVAPSQKSSASHASCAQSRIDTVVQLGSSVSKAIEAPQCTAETSTNQILSSDLSRLMAGVGLGAAAGAAVMYTLMNAEQRNAQDEAVFEATVSTSSPRSRLPPMTVEAVLPASRKVLSNPKTSHRNFSSTESNLSARHSRVLAIDSSPYDKADSFPGVHQSRRAGPAYRVTEEYAYFPTTSASSANNTFSVRRATTLPVEVEGERQPIDASLPPSSRRNSHHEMTRSVASHRSSHHDSSPRSVASYRSSHHDSLPRSVASSSRHSFSSRHRRSSYNDDKSSRHDSAISLHSSRSRRDRDRVEDLVDSSRKSSASTVKPSRRESVHHSTMADASRAGSRVDASSQARSVVLRPASHYESAVEAPLPRSVASNDSATRAQSNHGPNSYISAADLPLPASVAPPPLDEATNAAGSWEDVAQESDGMGDLGTVVPDDSISMVASGRQPRRRRHHQSGGSNSQRSDTIERTIRPVRVGSSRHSASTLPIRVRPEEYEKSRGTRRSIYSYA